ncbi:MAG: Polysaccharide biosynthesis protein [Parcubacteria group bacterium GW2011_GWE2_39_37]|nr:MAG: Polysaccharide biosynthesis protein [Parcubacteria group bacterium GW2011_GWE2_39_37]
MSEKVINIAKNTSYYTLALVVQKVISFTYFVIIARALGPEDLGKYYFAISFTTIFSIFIDLGLTNVLTRETAKDHTDAQKYLSNVLGIKIPLAVLSFLMVFGVINLMGYPELTKYLVYISAISMILDSFTATFFGVARGFHNLIFESISSIIFQAIVLAAGLFTLNQGYGILWLMGTLAFASLYNFVFSYIIIRKKIQLKVKPEFKKDLIISIVKISLPFAIYGIFSRLYTYLDSVLLSSLAGDREVGVYQVAFKIINALQFLPMAFAASLYPAFASYWMKNKPQLAVTFERSINYLLIISLPITIGIMSIADKVVILFKSEYSDAVLPLQINIAALVFVFLNFAIGAILNACDKQKINTVNMMVVTVASIALNLFLIPRFQAIGASITVVITSLLAFVLGMAIIPKIIQYNHWKVFKNFLKVGFVSLVMGGLSYFLKSYLNIFVVVIISAGTYFLLLLLVGAFKKEDIFSIISSFKKKSGEGMVE